MGSCPVNGIFLRFSTLAALGVVVGAAHSWYHPVKLTLEPALATHPTPTTAPSPTPSGAATPTSTSTQTQPPTPAALELHLTIEQTKKLWDQGVPFVDARLAKEWAKGVVSGSRMINPLNFSDPDTLQALQFMDTAKPVVVYCGGGDCHDSENVVILLQQFGFTDLHIFTDGFPAWQAAGFDIETPVLKERP